ncbi:hypothetical protein PtrEW13061_011966, partial [Pyrenophora tritici-repentis]
MKIFLGTVTFLALFQMGLAYPHDILDPRKDPSKYGNPNAKTSLLAPRLYAEILLLMAPVPHARKEPGASPVPREANVALEFAAAKSALSLNAETALAAAR